MLKRYIITGAPGTGKTTLLNELKNKGYSCVDEISRTVIKEQQLLKTKKTPWENLSGFIDLVSIKTIQQLQNPITEITFVDRGLPDCIAYINSQNLKVPETLTLFDHHHYYHKDIFLLPPWKSIYVKDKQRQQSFKEALLIHKKIVSIYSKLNFNIIELPKKEIDKRIKAIIPTLS